MDYENDELRTETRGRPLKGYMKMDIVRRVRLDPDTDMRLKQKCRRLGCTIADGIREGIILFLNDRRY